MLSTRDSWSIYCTLLLIHQLHVCLDLMHVGMKLGAIMIDPKHAVPFQLSDVGPPFRRYL